MIVTVLVVAQKIQYIVECADQTIVRAHALTVIRQPTAQMLAVAVAVKFRLSTVHGLVDVFFVRRSRFSHFDVFIAVGMSMKTAGHTIESVVFYALICALMSR